MDARRAALGQWLASCISADAPGSQYRSRYQNRWTAPYKSLPTTHHFFVSSGGQCIYEYPEMAQQPEWPEERCAQRSFYWVAAVVVQLAKPCMQRARHEALFEETIG